jgi:hypothetical protein
MRQAPAAVNHRRVLVLGGGGALGGAVLEQLLASHRFERVGVLASPTLQPALRGLQAVADDGQALAAFAPDTALIVFDRERHANGRDAAFVRPAPDALATRALQLRGAGVRALLVVVPHAPALLPQALKAGLATLDEGAVAAMDFQQVAFMRMAQAGAGAQGGHRLQRLAGWLLSQLHWLVPQREQPVRGLTVARVAAAIAMHLPAAAPGTRVLAPEWLWLAAQAEDTGALMAAWLAGQPPPAAPVRQRW